VACSPENAYEVLASLYRDAHTHLRALAFEPAKILGLSQRPIEPGRRYLQPAVLDLLHGEQPREMIADGSAVIYVYAFGTVDEHADQPTARQFGVHQLEAEPVYRSLQKCSKFLLSHSS